MKSKHLAVVAAFAAFLSLTRAAEPYTFTDAQGYTLTLADRADLFPHLIPTGSAFALAPTYSRADGQPFDVYIFVDKSSTAELAGGALKGTASGFAEQFVGKNALTFASFQPGDTGDYYFVPVPKGTPEDAYSAFLAGGASTGSVQLVSPIYTEVPSTDPTATNPKTVLFFQNEAAGAAPEQALSDALAGKVTNVTPVPEPSVVVTLIGGIATLLLLRSRHFLRPASGLPCAH